MNEIKIFKSEEFGEIRCCLIDNEIWFVGRDVVKDLGYDLNNHSYTEYIKKYCDEEDIKKLNNRASRLFGIEDAGRKGELLINEYALYDLALESPLPSAKKFKRWITHEVIPQIRKTGGYIPLNNEDDEETIMAKALIIANNTINKKDELIKQIQPKADWFDEFMSSEGSYNSTQIAKLFKLSSAQKLNKLLHENKIIYKQGKNWYTYKDVDESWYKLVVGNSNEHSYSQLKFTPKGIYEISKLLEINFTKEDLKELA